VKIFLNNSLYLLIPEIIKIIATLFQGLIIAKIIGPENLGIISSSALIITYGVHLQLGIFNGLGLKIPYLIGKGESEVAKKEISEAATGVFLILIIIFPIVLIITFLVNEPIIKLGLLANYISLFFYQIFNIMQAKARFFYNMKTVSTSQILQTLSQFLIYVTLVYFFGIVGAFVGIAIYYIPPIIFLYLKKERIHWHLNKNTIKNLIKNGFPWMVSGSIFSVTRTLDKLSIITIIGTAGLGFYTIAFNLTTILTQLPIKIASLLNQYLREAKGAQLKNHELWYMVDYIITISLLAIIPLSLLTKHLSYFIIEYFLFEYRVSLELIDLMHFAIFFLVIYHYVYQFLVSIDNKKLTIKFQILGLLCSALIYFIFGITIGNLFGTTLAFIVSSVIICSLLLVGLIKCGIRIKMSSIIKYVSLFISLLSFSYFSSYEFLTSIFQPNSLPLLLFVIFYDLGILALMINIILKIPRNESTVNFFNRNFVIN